MLSDRDIKAALANKSIKINEYYTQNNDNEPRTHKCYEIKDNNLEKIDRDFEKNIQPCGYDLRVGIEGFSWKNKRIINIQEDKKIFIYPNETVIVRTLEEINLSSQISGTIHATATLSVGKALSHISTIIDPCYQGTLLISLSNNSKIKQELKFKEKFCTICFYRVVSTPLISTARSESRTDLWELLNLKSRSEVSNRKKCFFVFLPFYIFTLFLLYCCFASDKSSQVIDSLELCVNSILSLVVLLFHIIQTLFKPFLNIIIPAIAITPIILGVRWVNPSWFSSIIKSLTATGNKALSRVVSMFPNHKK